MSKSLLILTALAGSITGATSVEGECRPIAGDRILGGDLALADPRFASLPRSLMLGFAPNPGTRRTFTPAELGRIARANGISVGSFEDICFELPMTRLRDEDVTAAMRRSLPPEATVRVVEISRFDVPMGELEFPRQGLEPATPATPTVQLWRGAVKYAPARRFDVWARVEVSAPFRAIVPLRDLPAGVPVGLSSLGVEVRPQPLSGERALSSIEDVVGRQPRHIIRAGSSITRVDLIDTPVVRKGDVVTVEVESGPARLRFEAVAEAPGRAGEIVELRNPGNGKAFKARIESGATALVVIPARPVQ